MGGVRCGDGPERRQCVAATAGGGRARGRRCAGVVVRPGSRAPVAQVCPLWSCQGTGTGGVDTYVSSGQRLSGGCGGAALVVQGVAGGLGVLAGERGGGVGEHGVAGGDPAGGVVAEFVDDAFGSFVVPGVGLALGAAPDGAPHADVSEGDGEPAALGGDVAAVAVLVGVAA